jgi:hypothetical protein
VNSLLLGKSGILHLQQNLLQKTNRRIALCKRRPSYDFLEPLDDEALAGAADAWPSCDA